MRVLLAACLVSLAVQPATALPVQIRESRKLRGAFYNAFHPGPNIAGPILSLLVRQSFEASDAYAAVRGNLTEGYDGLVERVTAMLADRLNGTIESKIVGLAQDAQARLLPNITAAIQRFNTVEYLITSIKNEIEASVSPVVTTAIGDITSALDGVTSALRATVTSTINSIVDASSVLTSLVDLMEIIELGEANITAAVDDAFASVEAAVGDAFSDSGSGDDEPGVLERLTNAAIDETKEIVVEQLAMLPDAISNSVLAAVVDSVIANVTITLSPIPVAVEMARGEVGRVQNDIANAWSSVGVPVIEQWPESPAYQVETTVKGALLNVVQGAFGLGIEIAEGIAPVVGEYLAPESWQSALWVSEKFPNVYHWLFPNADSITRDVKLYALQILLNQNEGLDGIRGAFAGIWGNLVQSLITGFDNSITQFENQLSVTLEEEFMPAVWAAVFNYNAFEIVLNIVKDQAAAKIAAQVDGAINATVTPIVDDLLAQVDGLKADLEAQVTATVNGFISSSDELTDVAALVELIASGEASISLAVESAFSGLQNATDVAFQDYGYLKRVVDAVIEEGEAIVTEKLMFVGAGIVGFPSAVRERLGAGLLATFIQNQTSALEDTLGQLQASVAGRWGRLGMRMVEGLEASGPIIQVKQRLVDNLERTCNAGHQTAIRALEAAREVINDRLSAWLSPDNPLPFRAPEPGSGEESDRRKLQETNSLGDGLLGDLFLDGLGTASRTCIPM